MTLGAYPRSRGGTLLSTLLINFEEGLSPLTRGNHCSNSRHLPPPGPIPAHAGEPVTYVNIMGLTGAYPRSRGGTAAT